MKKQCYSYNTEKDYGKHCINEAKLLPVSKRQEFIDCIMKEHMCIGDAGKKADLNNEQYTGILSMQIKSTSYLDSEVK